MIGDISLVTICWNAEGTLQRTLEGVLAQEVLPREYRVVDGGSTDGTLALLERWQGRFRERGVDFQVERQVRLPGEAGIPGAWNQALAQVRYGIVALLNADDWYDPPVLRLVEEAFRRSPALGALSLPVWMHPASPGREWLFRPASLGQLPWRMPVPHPGTFFRRTTYERVGRYDTAYRIAADYDFIWRCHLAKIPWGTLDQACIHMQLGGLANASRALARRETYRIARRHGSPWDPRPALAWLLRALSAR